MAKLRTPKKLDKIVPDQENIIEYGWKKVSDWTKQELHELQKNSKLPIITELANGDYTVATYRIKKVSSVCWEAAGFEFIDKRSAIFYCALTHIGRSNEAAILREADGIVGKLDIDKAIFRVRLDEAHIIGDSFKIDLYSSRFDEAKRNLNAAKQDLEKLLNRAKYHMN